MIICTLYNHKGGVSKTTTTFNLAHSLANQGSKVIVVDADPQCNLTELFMAPIIDAADAALQEVGGNQDLPGNTLLNALKPRFDGRAPWVDVDAIQLVRAPSNANLQLFRGDVDLNEAEDGLSQAHIQRLGNQTHYKYSYVAIHDMLRRLGAREQTDFMLVDVGPSAGSITRSCFLACDAFYVPVAPDRFNVQAIGSLSRIIGRWMTEHAQAIDDFRQLELPISLGKPYFLGTVVQNFKLSRGTRPRPGFEMWMRRIPDRIQSELVPVLTSHSTPERNLNQVVEEMGATEAARIPDFGSLITCMQECSKPIFGLEQADTAVATTNGLPWTGATWDGAVNRMATWRALFDHLVERLIRLATY